MATREYDNDQNRLALSGSIDIFEVPSGETWLVNRLSRRATAASSANGVFVNRELASTTEQEILDDVGAVGAPEPEDVNITNMQGKVLKAGDKIVAGKSSGTITMNFHIDFLRIVP